MFTIKNGKPEIEAKALFIPEFKRLWSRDKTKRKARAVKELAYVYFMADYKSEYNIYGIEKPKMIAIEIMNNEHFEPDEFVLDAIDKYERLQETYSMRYLKSVRNTIDSMMKFYNELQYKAGQDNVLDYNPDRVMKSMKEVEIIVEKIEKWERKVRSEEETMKIKGGGKVGIFEDAEKATWLKISN